MERANGNHQGQAGRRCAGCAIMGMVVARRGSSGHLSAAQARKGSHGLEAIRRRIRTAFGSEGARRKLLFAIVSDWMLRSPAALRRAIYRAIAAEMKKQARQAAAAAKATKRLRWRSLEALRRYEKAA